MAYQSPGPPPFNLILQLKWPWSVHGYNPGDMPPLAELECWLVPCSRLTVFGTAGYTATKQGGLIPPAVNYYVETPSGSEYLIIPSLIPLYAAPGTVFDDTGFYWGWNLDGCGFFEDPTQGYNLAYLCAWWERRWYSPEEYWVRTYLIGADWSAVAPLPDTGPPRITRKGPDFSRVPWGKGIWRPGEMPEERRRVFSRRS